MSESAQRRGIVKAYAKAAGGVFLTHNEYGALIKKLENVTNRMKEAEKVVEEIKRVQGFYYIDNHITEQK